MPEPPPQTDGATACDDGVRRCGWACSTQDYHAYHDTEWRVARFTERDVRRLLEDAGIVRHRGGSRARVL